MPPHILIVDDEPQVGFFLHQSLRSMNPEYVVSTAQTGAEALRLAQQELFGLVITDYRLKDMDGLALVAALRQLERSPPVIMITAGPPPEVDPDIIRCIQKPFSTAQLAAVIDEILGDTLSSEDPGAV